MFRRQNHRRINPKIRWKSEAWISVSALGPRSFFFPHLHRTEFAPRYCASATHTHAKTAIPRILLSGCGAGKRRKDAPSDVISVPSLATTRMNQRAGSLEMSSDISRFDT